MLEKNELIAANIEVAAPSIEQSLEQSDSDEFMANRFYAMSLSHNSAIFIGSSLAHQHLNNESEHVLDSAASISLKDKNGVIIGLTQATADGLGGSSDDPHENQSIANIAEFSCSTFIHSIRNARETYYDIAIESKKQLSQVLGMHPYDSHCAMAAAKFTYAGDGTYSGELSNMGDTTVLVLDRNFKIKNILPSRQIYRGFGVWTPPSVQMLNLRNMQHHFANIELQASEGDYIISMTDGVWGELSSTVTQTQEDVKEFSLDSEELGLDPSTDLTSYFPIHHATLDILTHAIDRSLKKRHELFNLVDELNSLEFTKESHTVNEVLEYLRKKGKNTLADQLYQVLFIGNNGDGILYFKEVEIPISFVMNDLHNRTAGDCSTINMNRLPFHSDELLRAFINYPEKRNYIFKELMPYLDSNDALQESIARLKQEEVLVEPKLLLKDLKTKPVFSQHMLDELQQLLEHATEVYALLDNDNYHDKLNNVSDYFENLQKPTMRAYLFDLIKNELSPPRNLISYFFSDDSALFRKFSESFGPGQVFSITDFIETDDEQTFSL